MQYTGTYVVELGGSLERVGRVVGKRIVEERRG